MAMGNRAADNIHQQILSEQEKIQPSFTEWPEVPPMIALAVGTKAAVYDPVGGVKCSEEMMKVFFDNDLGFNCKSLLWPSELPSTNRHIDCYNHLKLGEAWQ